MKYTSIYSPNKKVSESQLLAELVCQKKADNLKIELPAQFWNIMPEWLGYYQIQLSAASKLLDKFDFEVLIKVIKEKNIYSLRPNWILQYFQKEQDLAINNKKENILTTRITDSTGKFSTKKNFNKFDE